MGGGIATGARYAMPVATMSTAARCVPTAGFGGYGGGLGWY